MKIKSALFLKSSTAVRQLPEADKPEVAFIGRSNVGKSSLINTILNRKDLAHTSSQPGKTQTINHYLVNSSWYLVDLPGYGFAKVSRTTRESWEKMLNAYLRERENLLCVFVLVDVRIPPQESDIDFINRLGKNQIPLAIVFTKADKTGMMEMQKNIGLFRETLLEEWEELPPCFTTSAVKGMGKDELLGYLTEVMAQWIAPSKRRQ